GLVLRGCTITPYDKNPFIVRSENGQRQIKTTKVIIGNVPISYSDSDIESKLCQIGCKIRSKMLMERDRDEHGGLTRWLTGRRFVYIDVPQQPLPSKIHIGPCQATIFNYHQPRAHARDPFRARFSSTPMNFFLTSLHGVGQSGGARDCCCCDSGDESERVTGWTSYRQDPPGFQLTQTYPTEFACGDF
ncbi:hypothetical protein BaRGS_00036212, partial [Batillaria attramentaria]